MRFPNTQYRLAVSLAPSAISTTPIRLTTATSDTDASVCVAPSVENPPAMVSTSILTSAEAGTCDVDPSSNSSCKSALRGKSAPNGILDDNCNPSTPKLLAVPQAIDFLLNNNFDALSSAAVILTMKYLANILANPSEDKFRQINPSNKAFCERILPAKGASDLLQAVGFQRFDSTSSESGSDSVSSFNIRLTPTDDEEQRLGIAFDLLSAAALTVSVQDV